MTVRTFVHLSDLHFGRIDAPLLQPLIEMTRALAPNAVVISGDLTQRAREAQFKEARAFLDRLPPPHIIVPGNHDVPLYDLVARFFRSLRMYRRHITEDLEPFYADGEVAILGLNTARSLTIKDGRISKHQIATIRRQMCGMGKEIIKMLVTHHPFDLPDGSHHKTIVGRAHEAMGMIAQCGVDVILSGHLHVSHIGHAAKRFDVHGRSTLLVQAGTATSTRARGEPNAFNVIRSDGPRLTVEQMVWDRSVAAFVKRSTERFERSPAGWIRLGP